MSKRDNTTCKDSRNKDKRHIIKCFCYGISFLATTLRDINVVIYDWMEKMFVIPWLIAQSGIFQGDELLERIRVPTRSGTSNYVSILYTFLTTFDFYQNTNLQNSWENLGILQSVYSIFFSVSPLKKRIKPTNILWELFICATWKQVLKGVNVRTRFFLCEMFSS